jgi:hypothetical protein
MQKIKKFNVKWILKDKNLQHPHHLKHLNFKNIYFIFLCDRHNVVISKVHYKSIIFLEFIQTFYDDSHYNL